MANLSSSWVYRETLRQCAAFLVENYSIRPQVDALSIHMLSNGHISQLQLQYVSETVHTTDKMTQLLGYIMTPDITEECFNDLLWKLDEDTQRIDIPNKLRKTLDEVKNSSQNKNNEININVHDLLNNLQDNYMYLTPVEMIESIKTIQQHCIPRSFEHHSKFPFNNNDGQSSRPPTEIPKTETTEIMRTLTGDDSSEDIVKTIRECNDSGYLNSCNDQNQTLLMVACKYSNAVVVKTLLENDIVEVNATDLFGRTALMYGMLRQDVDVIAALINNDRIDMDIKDKNGLGYAWYMFGEVVLTELTSKVHVIQSRADMEGTLDDCIVRMKEHRKNFDWENLATIIELLLLKPTINHTDLLDVMVLLGNEMIVSLILQMGTTEITAENLLDFVVRAIISSNVDVFKLIMHHSTVSLHDLPINELEEIMRSVIRRADPKICETMLGLVKGIKVNKALEVVMGLQTMETNALSISLSCYDRSTLNIKDSDGNSVFMIACNFGSYDLVSKMLEIPDVDFSVRNSLDQSAFMLSLGNKCLDIPHLLLQQLNIPFNINDSSMFGVTNLMYASKKGNVSLVKELLAYPGVNINACDLFGTTVLMYACSGVSGDVVSLLIEQPNIDVTAKDDAGMPALLFACWGNNTGVIETILTHKNVNVNTKYTMSKARKDAMTALMYSCQCGKVEAVRLLLKQREIRVNEFCAHMNAFKYAVAGTNADVVRLLLDDERLALSYWDNKALTIACSRNASYDIIEVLVKKGKFNVNKGNVTALIWACINGNTRVVSLLLSVKGIDINKMDSSDQSAMTYALREGNHNVVNMLLETGSVNFNRTANQNMLMLACKIGLPDVVMSILNASVRVNEDGRNRNTPMEDMQDSIEKFGRTTDVLADFVGAAQNTVFGKMVNFVGENFYRSNDKVVKLDVNFKKTQIHYGKTPLIAASENGKSDVVRLLLKHEGIDVNSTDCAGKSKTALIYACENSCVEVVDLLLQHQDVDVNVVAMNGETAISAACGIKCDLKIITALLERQDIKRDVGDKTLLMTASMQNNSEVVSFVLNQHDSNIHATDTQGRNAFMLACEKDNLDVVKVLLNCGINVNDTDINGENGLMIACESKSSAVVQFLLEESHVEWNATDNKGTTVCSYVLTLGNKKIIELMKQRLESEGNVVDLDSLVTASVMLSD